MRKIFILSIIFMITLLPYKNVRAENNDFTTDNVIRFDKNDGEFTIGYIARDNKNYLYLRDNGANYINISKVCLETDEKIQLFNLLVEDVKSTYVQDNVIYTAFVEDQTSSAKIRVLGYNIETEEVSFDKSFAVRLYDWPYGLASIAVDKEQNVYFAIPIGENTKEKNQIELYSFDKDGNKLDSLQKDIPNGYHKAYFSSCNGDSTAIFLRLEKEIEYDFYNDDYVIKINNGRFAGDGIYKIRENGGMDIKFLDSQGKYAYTRLGEILEFNYNDNSMPSGVSYKVKKSIMFNGNNIESEGIYFSDNKYIYIGSKSGMIYIIDKVSFNIEKIFNLGTKNKVEGVYKNGEDILAEYVGEKDTYNYKYYIKKLNISDFTDTKKDIKLTTHKALEHSKEDIKKKYKDAEVKYTSKDIYDVEPSITAPYREGNLKTEVKFDTLNQINYFRYLAGVNNVIIPGDYVGYAEKGAVLLAANGKLENAPSKPEDMEDEFYDTALQAVLGNEEYGISASTSYGTSMAYSIQEHMNNAENRLSIINPKGRCTRFGYANGYGVVDIFYNKDDIGEDAFYSWPSPGNFPTESTTVKSKWHIQFSNNGYYVSGSPNIVLKANGKTYSSDNGDFNIEKNEFYNAYSFDLPNEIKKYLSTDGYWVDEGKTVEVEVHNIIDNEANSYVISYPVNFFAAQEDYLLADVNNDKKVNLIDYTKILAHVRKTSTLVNKSLKAADVNKDGKVNLIDYTKVLAHVKQTALLW